MTVTRLLVVEDARIVALDIERRLEAMGYSVCGTAVGQEEAVSKAEETKPDVVLMDIMLKDGGDGIAAAELIWDKFGVPVIFLTAYADGLTVERARRARPFGYVMKPFEDREVQRSIELALYRRTAERRLQESERLLQAVLRGLGEGIVATDAAGRIRLLNPAAETLTGWKEKEAVGRPLEEVVALPVPLNDGAHTLAARHGGSARVEVTSAPLHDQEGQSSGGIVVIRDVTEKLRASEEREALQESLGRAQALAKMGELVAGVAHEIRSPLAAIVTSLDTFGGRFRDREEYEKFAGALRTEANRLSDLMRSLVEFGRPPAEGKASASPDYVLSQAVQACRPAAEEARVRLRGPLPRGLPEVTMDSRRIIQALENLILNAIQHTLPGGDVRVQVEMAQRAGRRVVEWRVNDTGPGFDETDLPQVFEPFYSRRRGGTGLGLSIVRRIAEDHQGEAVAQNSRFGGAEVVLRVPVSEASGPPKPRAT